MKIKKTNNGKKGGLLKGKRHYDKDGNSIGGIKAIVTDNNNMPVELEGGEVIINREASKKHWKELSKINQSAGNGVPILPPQSVDTTESPNLKEGGKISKKELQEGIKAELEHSDTIKKIAKQDLTPKQGAKLIAKDHLKESDKYYEELKKMESKFGKGRTIAQTPAPKKERIFGSEVNKEGSSKSKGSAKSIKFSEKTLNSIQAILDKHNKKYTDKEIDLNTAKAVVRRGMGAYSVSHRPTISGGELNSRVAWGLARLNAFVYKVQKGKSKSGKYTQDDDLIDSLNKYKTGGNITDSEKQEIYKKWADLVNMSASELKRFMESEEGKKAGLSKEQANKLGIHYGRESARWILKMKATPRWQWTPKMWEWANRQISFNSRMRGNQGALYDDKGNKTRKHLSLLIWGHNPEKYNTGGNLNYHLGGDMSKHLAPNGKPSNLTHEQWHLVRTPEFKAWFGDWEKLAKAKLKDSGMDEVTLSNLSKNVSKVVDENGEPLVVFHGTNKEFNVFSEKGKGNRVLGYFFTANKDFSENYGETKLYFLNIKKIKNYVAEKFDYLNTRQNAENGYWDIEKEKLLKELYNGILIDRNDFFAGINIKRKDFIAFEPNQIKLADGSNTTFDTNNPDIRFEEGGEIENLISKGIIDLKFYETTPEHAKEYGLKAKKPIFVQNLCVSEKERLKGIGKKVLDYLEDYARKNGNDIIFGYVAKNASFSKDSMRSNFCDVDMIKNWLNSNGYAINYDNNDFHKVISINKSKNENKFKQGDVSGDVFSIKDQEQFAQIITLYNNFSEKFNIDNYFIDDKDNSVVFLRKVKFTPIELNEMSKYIADLSKNQKFSILSDKEADISNGYFKFFLKEKIKYAQGGLIAPNGKKSNLNAEQYKLVRTKAFKEWFGDWENDPENASKIVDENGEPKIVWHGSKSPKDFNVFQQNPRFEFIYFADNKYYAKYHFSKGDMSWSLRPFFLNIRNLLNAEEFGFDKVTFKELNSFFYGIHDLSKDIQLNPKSEYRFWEVLRFSNDIYDSLKNQKYYTGISYYENFYDNTTWNDTYDYSLSYVVINPNQIKLADGTNTTFDSNNPDIRFDKGGLMENEPPANFENQLWNELANRYGNGGKMEVEKPQEQIKVIDSKKIKNIEKVDKMENSDIFYNENIYKTHRDYILGGFNSNELNKIQVVGDETILNYSKLQSIFEDRLQNAIEMFKNEVKLNVLERDPDAYVEQEIYDDLANLFKVYLDIEPKGLDSEHLANQIISHQSFATWSNKINERLIEMKNVLTYDINSVNINKTSSVTVNDAEYMTYNATLEQMLEQLFNITQENQN